MLKRRSAMVSGLVFAVSPVAARADTGRPILVFVGHEQ
jgi:hypothetical protein